MPGQSICHGWQPPDCATMVAVRAAGLVMLAVAALAVLAMAPAAIAADATASSTRPAARALRGRPEASLTGMSLRWLAWV